MPIIINLDVELAKKKLSVADFATAIDITPANVSVLKNGRAKAVRFSTLDAICRVLECQPGDILSWVPDGDPSADDQATVEQATRDQATHDQATHEQATDEQATDERGND